MRVVTFYDLPGIPHTETPYGATFEQAIRRFHELESKTNSARQQASLVGTQSFGQQAESSLRASLEQLGIGTEKHEAKGEFLNLLYLLRVYLLKITPSTPRPLGGAAYEGSLSALNAIAQQCQAAHIELRLFLAPQNPGARLWRTEADRERYRGAAQRLAKDYGLRMVDLEKSIPAEQWGVWIDGPDPIHFGLKGHETMAAAMLASELL